MDRNLNSEVRKRSAIFLVLWTLSVCVLSYKTITSEIASASMKISSLLLLIPGFVGLGVLASRCKCRLCMENGTRVAPSPFEIEPQRLYNSHFDPDLVQVHSEERRKRIIGTKKSLPDYESPPTYNEAITLVAVTKV